MKNFKVKKSLIWVAVCLVLLFSLILSTCRTKEEPSEKGENIVVIKTNLGDITLELFSDLAPKTVANFVDLASGEKMGKPFYDGLIFHRVIKDFMIQGGCPLGTGTGGPGYTFEDECYEQGELLIGNVDSEEKALEVFQAILVPYLQKNGHSSNKEIVDLVTECGNQQSGKPLMGKSVEDYQVLTGQEDKKFYTKGKLKASVDYGTICMANSGPNTNGSQFFIVTKKDGCDWLNGKHTVFGKVIDGMDVVLKIQDVKTGAQDKPVEKVVIEKVVIKN